MLKCQIYCGISSANLHPAPLQEQAVQINPRFLQNKIQLECSSHLLTNSHFKVMATVVQGEDNSAVAHCSHQCLRRSYNVQDKINTALQVISSTPVSRAASGVEAPASCRTGRAARVYSSGQARLCSAPLGSQLMLGPDNNAIETGEESGPGSTPDETFS